MVSKLVSKIADLCETITIFISLGAYLPQWRMMIKNRSSQNHSIVAWLIWLFSGFLGLFYAIVQYINSPSSYVLVFSMSANMLFVLGTLLMVAYYRKFERQQRMKAAIAAKETKAAKAADS